MAGFFWCVFLLEGVWLQALAIGIHCSGCSPWFPAQTCLDLRHRPQRGDYVRSCPIDCDKGHKIAHPELGGILSDVASETLWYQTKP